MNQRAAQLGCKNTHFNNPNGLPDETHYTTASIYIFTDDSRHIVALTQCCQLLENCRMVTERAADTEQNAFIFHCSVSPLYIPR